MLSRTRIELFLSIEGFKKGAIKSPKKTNNKILNKDNPNISVIEKTFVGSGSISSLKLGMARGASMIALAEAGLIVNELSPKFVKKTVTGYGSASKAQIKSMIEKLLNIVPKNEDSSDALAIAIGTSHGAYKFSRPPTGDILAINRIKEIHSRLPNTHLVMHGSSSVPQDLIKTINEYGGKIKETYGVPVSEIQEGIKQGVRKVNVDTDLRLAATAAVRKYFHENPSQFDPRKYLLLSKDAMKEVVKSRLQEFGTAGNASSINSISLGVMATKYKSGEFTAVIN